MTRLLTVVSFLTLALLVFLAGCGKPVDATQPVESETSIELPLVITGSLLPEARPATNEAANSTQQVFSNYTIFTIGAEPGYSDITHQMVTFRISITNTTSEKVTDVRVTLLTSATSEQKPVAIRAEPETAGRLDFEPNESETYVAAWRLDGSKLSKPEMVRLVEETIVNVSFTTQDGRELMQSLSTRTP